MKLQFGMARPELDYRHRPAVFGIAERDGLIACVQIKRDASPAYYDLPGGAIEGEETEAQALAREFTEETGLSVSAVDRLTEASQYFVRTDGEALNNVCAFWIMHIEARHPERQQEQDHKLVWLTPQEALSKVRHDAHAWAISCWLRQKARHQETAFLAEP